MRIAAKYIFLRDDDVYRNSDRFLRTLRFLVSMRVPVNYGVIPALLTPAAAQTLRRVKAEHPRLLDIVQHGWKHTNRGTLRLRYEFGKGRNPAQQKADILAGCRRMRAEFGAQFTPAFIPPFHGYDDDTVRVLRQLGFCALSAGGTSADARVRIPRLLPAQVSVNRYTPDFRPLPVDLPSLIREFLCYLGACRIVGILFHHETFDETNFKAFRFFVSFVRALARRERIKIVTFRGLLGHSGDIR